MHPIAQVIFHYSLLTDRGSIQGELRKPQVDIYTPGTSTETVHIENGVKYTVSSRGYNSYI